MAVEAPTVGSLFSGGGGLDYGLEKAGFEVRWQVEWDPWQQHVLQHGWGGRWATTRRYGDVSAVDFAAVEPVDLLAGGFPCQPVSTAGKRLGQADERWLWPEFARAVRVLRPRYVLVENVPGLLVRGLGDVLGDLAEIGYDAEWTSFPAAALGAPHLRDRVWIVAVDHAARERARRTRVRTRRSGAPWPESAEFVGRLSDPLADASRVGVEGDWTDWLVIPPAPSLAELLGCVGAGRGAGFWAVEPDVGRMAHGVARRGDRLWTLGNGVVPAVGQVMGMLIRRAMDATAG